MRAVDRDRGRAVAGAVCRDRGRDRDRDRVGRACYGVFVMFCGLQLYHGFLSVAVAETVTGA